MIAFFVSNFRTVLLAESSFVGLVGAPVVTASFDLCPMPFANSSFDGSIGTSFMAASWLHCSMPHADSSRTNLVGASLVVACFASHLCPVLSADSSLLPLVGTSFVAACFCCTLYSMSGAGSTSHNVIRAPINRAQPLPLLFHRAIKIIHGYLALCNHTNFTVLSTAFDRGMSCVYCRKSIQEATRRLPINSADKKIKATR